MTADKPRATTPFETSVSVSVKGDVPETLKEVARTKFAAVPARCSDPIRSIDVRLIALANPSLERPAVVEVVADLDGSPVRARAEATRMAEAIDITVDHLVRRLARAEAQRHRKPERTKPEDAEHEWRHGQLPRQPLRYYPRRADEREVVRRKAFELKPISVDEAAFDLEQLGHDFYLFTDVQTGGDCVLFHSDADLVLLCEAGREPDVSSCAAPIRVRGVTPSVASLADAEDQLDLGEEPFVFFRSPDTGRGSVLYRRLDGHYGLITPSGQ